MSKEPATTSFHLPLEILSHIMGYLDFSSRREAALVCKSWYNATLDPHLLKNTRYTFDATILDDEKHFIDGDHVLVGCLCKSPNLHITGLDNNFNAKYFLRLHQSGMGILGPHVEHLSLKNSNIVERTLLEILQLCPNIKSLDLSGCNPLFMSGAALMYSSPRIDQARKCFSGITALNLSSSRFMNDATLNQLFAICPLIHSINLSSNNIICNSFGVSKVNSLTFLGICQLVSQRFSYITHIDFSRTSIVSDALTMLAITKGLKLKSVILRNCRELTNKGVVELVSHQREITSLILSGSPEVGNPSLIAICVNLKNLEILKLRKCTKITTHSIKSLTKLEKLRELDISECHEVSMAGLQCGLGGMENLRVLELKCCNLSRFSESFFLPSLTNGETPHPPAPVTSLSNELPQLRVQPLGLLTYALRHLDIGSSRYVDDVTLQAVNVHLINLEVLKLSWCSSITDRGLLGLMPERSMFHYGEHANEESRISIFLSSEKYPGTHGHAGLIKTPGMEYVPKKLVFSESELAQLMEEKGIIRLRKLRELTLANCKKLTLVGLLHVFRYKERCFPQLESLDLGMLYQVVNDEVLAAISNCSRISSLSLSFCSKITDEGLSELCKKLRALDTLNLSNCDGITERTITTLSRHCPWLRELDVSMCRQIPTETANKVKDMVPSLLSLHTRYSGGAGLDKTL